MTRYTADSYIYSKIYEAFGFDPEFKTTGQITKTQLFLLYNFYAKTDPIYKFSIKENFNKRLSQICQIQRAITFQYLKKIYNMTNDIFIIQYKKWLKKHYL